MIYLYRQYLMRQHKILLSIPYVITIEDRLQYSLYCFFYDLIIDMR